MALRAGDFVNVSGIGNAVVSTATNNISGHWTKIVSLIPGATAMRFAETPDALSYAGWLAYRHVHRFQLRTGQLAGTRTVYCEYVVPGVTNLSTTETVLNPLSHMFLEDAEQWASYDYDAGDGLNRFFPATWVSSGGPDANDPYILSDASRWASDIPETPPCVFMLLRRVGWCSSETETQSLYTRTITFYLKGNNLNANGGTIHYGVSTDDGFWHLDAPLTISNDAWTLNSVTIPLAGADGWSKSFDPGETGGNPDWLLINGEQIKCLGYSSEPTGAIQLAKWIPT
jgi:hypothetical protein